MIIYKKLEEDFNRKVKLLQARCKHKRLTPWAEIQWAVGHGTGTSARYCKRCQARVYYNYNCNICNDCGEKNSWYINTCLKCKSGNLTNYNVIEKLGKIIKKEFAELKRKINNGT